MRDWKIIIISATFAFTLSIIFGFFGSVSIGILLIRAISGATIFAALGFCMSFLLRKYLPELYELQKEVFAENMDNSLVKTIDPDNNSVKGTKIDISIADSLETPSVELKDGTDISSTSSKEDENLINDVSGDDQNFKDKDLLTDMDVFSNLVEQDSKDTKDRASKDGVIIPNIIDKLGDPELLVRAVRTMVDTDQEG